MLYVSVLRDVSANPASDTRWVALGEKGPRWAGTLVGDDSWSGKTKAAADRAAFIKKSFREDLADPAHYALGLNTAGLSVDQATEIVKASFRAKFP
jgi:hypothetical protein